ncbi:Spore germination protein B1 [Paenibacillus solanacearum]|uniref:Spore germination protein B1 n=1 Tax=Paenibacillus solanacearum TaxID=2048548 RepID=A0A916NR61_9BACL|nr:spore germination protein [Paenibacillus solanacearum]CAG7637086.1 Spore germination protein B1 [Paenibacillus solanacearum]
MGGSKDLVVREIRIGILDNKKACVFYIDGIVDTNAVNNFVMESLMVEGHGVPCITPIDSDVGAYLKEYVLTAGAVKDDVTDFKLLFRSLLSGSAILLIDGYTAGFAIEMSGGKQRSISEPEAETVIRGPREGFSESLRTNTALVRKKIRSPDLWLETSTIGTRTQTDVGIMYMKGIADEKIVEEVRARLGRIDIDGILESGYIEELIQDEVYTPFPTVYNSERPDAIAAELLEGKVAIMVDGTPVVLVVPAVFVSFLHSVEDYYHRADISTLIRILRTIGIAIGLFGPSLYVAITTFHREMIPARLLVSLAAQREAVPFPAFIEALLMEVTFEILREAGIRMPRPIGSAMSIVGSVVLGTAAVEAGFVSAAMVIIVAITALAAFLIPSNDMTVPIRMLRFPFMFLAASFGLFGIILGVIGLALHLSSLRSFGVPYLSPLAPFNGSGQKDVIVRLPIWAMLTRPRLISRRNLIRQRVHSPEYGRDKGEQGSEREELAHEK